MMLGLCIKCKKDGIDKEIDCEIVNSSGRIILRRFCGNHHQKKKQISQVI